MQGGGIEGVRISFVNDEITSWHIHIAGPAGTPYEGGEFVALLDFTDNYPFKCPKVNFVTKVYHPGIKLETGEICMQALQNMWKPTVNAAYIIGHLKDLLTDPSKSMEAP